MSWCFCLLEFGAKTKAYILYLILLHLVFLICTMGFFIPMAYGVNYNTLVFSRYYSFLVSICKERTWLIKLFGFGSTKSQRQISTANPDVRNEIKTFSAFLPSQKPIFLFPTAHFIFPSSWLSIFFPTILKIFKKSYYIINSLFINIILLHTCFTLFDNMFVGNKKKGWTPLSTSVHKISLQK